MVLRLVRTLHLVVRVRYREASRPKLIFFLFFMLIILVVFFGECLES